MSIESESLKVKRKYAETLQAISGVTGTGVNGSIIVYVEKLTPELRKQIPKSLEGIPVRIKERGHIVLKDFSIMDAYYPRRAGRWRPMPGGVSIGHPKISAGTFSCRAIDNATGRIDKGITNNHVGGLVWGEMNVGVIGDHILQPGPYDGGVDPADSNGVLEKIIPVVAGISNMADVIRFSCEDMTGDILELGTPSYTIEPRVGMTVVKSGRTSGITYGRITDIHASLVVDGGAGWGSCTFDDQIVVEPSILLGGDSGSWVGELDTYNTVGIGFAGSDSLSLVNKGKTVESLLDVTILPPIPPVKTAIPLAAIIGVGGIGLISLGGLRR